MESYDTSFKISELCKGIEELRTKMDLIQNLIKPEADLWDNSDMIRNWKISERTLATWRKDGLISYVQVNGKIWYPKNAREDFINSNLKWNANEES